MTKEEAIRLIGWLKCTTNREDDLEAIDMAIEALQTLEAVERIKTEVLPQTDLVRCKDCKHWHRNTEFCGIWSFQNIAQRTLSDDYCSRAERKEE